MKRSYTYLKGLLTLALAAFTGWMWAADPVATWTDFNTLTSGNYTITKDAACAVNDNGSITLGGAGLSVTMPNNVENITVVMDVSTLPASGPYTIINFPVTSSANVSLMYKEGKLEQEWNNGGDYGNATWTPGSGRYTIAFAYGKTAGATTYIDGVQTVDSSSLKTNSTSFQTFTIGSYLADNLIAATGMTVHSVRIYGTKLSAEEVAFPSLAWTVPFNGANTTTGWVTRWGGEADASYVTTPNGQGYEVKNGCHPWVDYTLAKPSTVALYADISKVAEPASNSNGAIMVAFGKPGSAGENTGNLVLAKKTSDTVVVTRSGAILASIKDADLALEGSYHLFVFGMNAEGKVFLSIDGAIVESENTTTLPTNGLQIGSMFTGVGSYIQGYNMVVDEVRGYNAYLGSEDLAKLVAKFPEYKPQIASVTLETDAAYSTLNLAEGDTVNATITLKDGVTLDMDKAPTCAMLTIISEGTATVTTSVAAPFANVGGLTLNGNAVTIPAQLPEAMTMNATTITLEGGTAEAPQEISSTITIASGKTLKTKGYLNFTAANTITGTLEVVSGETTFNLAGTGLNGTVKVAAGATFKNGTNDGPNYNGAPTFDIAGTLEVTGTARWSLPTNTTTTLRDGAILKGPGGTGYAYAYDYFNGATINVLGDATIEGNIGAHSPGDNGKIVFNIAEGKTLTLKGKYDGGVYGGQPTPPLQVTGAGTLKLENANTHAGTTVDTGAKIEVANASALPGAITNNGTITYTIDATPTNTLSGAGVTGVDAATLNMLSANLEGYTGSFAVANNGTLILPAGKEKGVTVAAGSTLKLALSDTDKAGGYTSQATINEGGIFAFVEADGSTPVTEGVNGGTYTPSLPKWTPTSAESSWDDVACWSTESVPTSGDVIVDASELDADIALEIPTSTTLGMVTIRSYEGRKVALSLADGASVASVAALGDLELPLAIVNDTGVAVSVADGKKLYVNVAEDAELTKAIIIDGTVVKQGAAKLTLKKSIFAGDGVTIDAGTIAYSDGAIAGNDQEEEGRLTSYTDMGNVLVKGGATLDFNGSANSWTNTVTLDEDATLANDSATALEAGARQLQAIVLNGDATLRANAQFSLTASSYAASTVTLNGHTLTKTGAASFVATNASISNGTFYLKEGRLDNSQGNISMASGITLKIDAGTTTSGAFNYQGDVAFDLADTVTMTTSAALSGNITKDGLGAWTISGVISGENSTVAVNAGTLTLSGANTRSANAITTIEKDATLVLSGESTKLYSDNFGGNQHGATLTIRGKLITGNWNYGYSLGGLRVDKPTVQIDGGTVEFTQSCNEGQDPRGFTVTVNGATFVMPDGMTYSKANPADGSNGIACNGTLNLTGAGTYQFGGAVSGAVVVGTNTKLESGTFNTLTLADGATLAGAVTVTGDVTVEGALTITHATAAGDTVLTCANADAVAAALTGAPAGLKYVAEDGAVKLAVAGAFIVGEDVYETFADAFAAAIEGEVAEITIDENAAEDIFETPGFKITKSVTIDLGGKTLRLTPPAVGSAGTETLGIQILKTAEVVVIKNGTIDVAESNLDAEKPIKMMINNYVGYSLTLQDMTLDGTNLMTPENMAAYTLSNNQGIVAIQNSTIKAKADGIAFDACKYASYDAPTVIVDEDSTIEGDVELSGGSVTAAEDAITVVSGLAGYKVVYNGTTYTLEKKGAFEVNGTDYATLAEAYAAGSEIKLTADAEALAFKIEKALTLDLGGKTLTLTPQGVGSTGTETLGIQIKMATTIKNGTIAVAESNMTYAGPGKPIKMLINNYADLTLENVILDGTNLYKEAGKVNYTLSNNSGEVTIDADSAIIANDGGIAFDVCKYASYTAPVVTVEDGATITGKVELSGGTLEGGASLTVESGVEGYKAVYDETEGWTLVKKGAFEVNGVDYATLAEAYAAGSEIKLTADAEALAFKIEKALTLDLGGKTLTLTPQGVGSTGTETLGIQIKKATTIKNGTIAVVASNMTYAGPGKPIKMLINNYADLTLENVTLDGTNLYKEEGKVNYTLSNNSGAVTIDADSVIIANDGGIAFDVCKYSTYTAPVVTVEDGATITGKVELSGGTLEGGASLTVESGVEGYKAVYDETEGWILEKILTLPEELVDSPAAEAIEAAMEAVGVTEITDYIITTTGTPNEDATVAAVAAVLEVFEVEPTVDANGVLTVAYEFGISEMTNAGDTITITAGVTGAEYREGVTVAFYADDAEIGKATTTADSTTVSITNVSATAINGKKITVKAIKQ